jgi:hypothetical protein
MKIEASWLYHKKRGVLPKNIHNSQVMEAAKMPHHQRMD